jgi:hypothetical protein
MACTSSTNSEYCVYIACNLGVAQPVDPKANEEKQNAAGIIIIRDEDEKKNWTEDQIVQKGSW